jgi:Tfp pilus assembly protein PilP
MRTPLFIPIVFAIALAGASAQTATPTPPAATIVGQRLSAPAAPGTPTAPTAPDNYLYQADGRRDPFLNLLGTGSDAAPGVRNEGPAGLTVAEIAVSGILESHGALIAMVQGPDKKTYIVHQGDKFMDGTIRSVTPQGLVILQEVNDPLSLVKQREIHKLLRSLESAKEKP